MHSRSPERRKRPTARQRAEGRAAPCLLREREGGRERCGTAPAPAPPFQVSRERPRCPTPRPAGAAGERRPSSREGAAAGEVSAGSGGGTATRRVAARPGEAAEGGRREAGLAVRGRRRRGPGVVGLRRRASEARVLADRWAASPPGLAGTASQGVAGNRTAALGAAGSPWGQVDVGRTLSV